jgi:hypothetical protein
MPKPKIITDFKTPIIRMRDYNVNNNDMLEYADNGLFCLTGSWYCAQTVINIVNTKKYKNIFVCANTEEEKDFYESKIDEDVILCNNNSFINENIYKILDNEEKKYDMIINSRFSGYKNTNFANLVTNVVHVGYLDDKKTKIPNFGYLPNFNGNIPNIRYTTNLKDIGYKYLIPEEIIKYANQSYTGGIFSSKEGTCMASSEYLLCGLPVISVKSIGGRDIWYNEKNSIICRNNKDDIVKCVNIAKEKIKNGEFDSKLIRQMHLDQMDINRNILTDYIYDKLIDMKNENVDKNKLKETLLYHDNNDLFI